MNSFTRRLRSFAVGVAIAALAAGCSEKGQAITEQVQRKLATDDALKSQQIDVTTEGRVVTLTGAVASETAKSRAMTLARETSGVTEVIDKLNVSSASPLQKPGVAAPADPSGGGAMPPTGGSGMHGGMGMHREMGMPPEGMMRQMPPADMSMPGTSPTQGSPAIPASALPGTPGVSHLYHIGSAGFFLDQGSISLTAEQRARLEDIKQRALAARGDTEKRIEAAEQELWQLTGAGAGDAEIQAKVQEIERARTDQRLAFIRAVGEASQVLTPEQQARLLGTATSSK